jgi:hypothetical protein
MIRRLPVFAPEAGAAAAALAVDAGAGASPADAAAGAAAAGAADGAAAGDTTADAAAAAAAAGPRWWEKLSDAQKTYVTATGRTKDNPMEVLPGIIDDYLNAQTRLGNNPANLLVKPKDGQALPEWMRANADHFGLPKEAEGYKIDRPADLPKDIPWNDKLEAQARDLAFKNGVPPEAHKAYVSLFAEHVKGLYGQSAEALALADGEMRDALARDWGSQMDARIIQAQQAASILAEKTGLDADALAGVVQVLSAKTGDANAIRVFHAIYEAIGDDPAVGMGKGGGSLGTTPADARAQLAALEAPGGDYFEATKAGNTAKVKELQPLLTRLHKLAAG